MKQFPAIRWISEPDDGISDAFNKGLDLAHGEYVLYLNSDDHFYDSRVLHDAFKYINDNQHPDWVVGDIAAQKRGEITIPNRRYPPSCWSLMFRCRVGHPTVFLKRRILQEVGGFKTRFKMAMDYDLWHRLCFCGYKPVYFQRIISVFSEEGLTSTPSPTLTEETKEVAGRFRDNPLKRLVGSAYDQFMGTN